MLARLDLSASSKGTSSIYNSSMILMAVLLSITLVARVLMRPVDPKYYLPV